MSRACRRAPRGCSHDRAEIEKPGAWPRASVAAMELKLSHCFVYVLDQDEALDFYTRVIGLEVRADAQMEVMRWLTVGPPGQPEVEIGLLEPTPPPVPEEDADALRALIA